MTLSATCADAVQRGALLSEENVQRSLPARSSHHAARKRPRRCLAVARGRPHRPGVMAPPIYRFQPGDDALAWPQLGWRAALRPSGRAPAHHVKRNLQHQRRMKKCLVIARVADVMPALRQRRRAHRAMMSSAWHNSTAINRRPAAGAMSILPAAARRRRRPRAFAHQSSRELGRLIGAIFFIVFHRAPSRSSRLHKKMASARSASKPKAAKASSPRWRIIIIAYAQVIMCGGHIVIAHRIIIVTWQLMHNAAKQPGSIARSDDAPQMLSAVALPPSRKGLGLRRLWAALKSCSAEIARHK